LNASTKQVYEAIKQLTEVLSFAFGDFQTLGMTDEYFEIWGAILKAWDRIKPLISGE
jgi:hypothetical protein